MMTRFIRILSFHYPKISSCNFVETARVAIGISRGMRNEMCVNFHLRLYWREVNALSSHPAMSDRRLIGKVCIDATTAIRVRDRDGDSGESFP